MPGGVITSFDPVETQDEFLFEDQFTSADWLESILESRTDSISRDRSRSVVTIICAFAKYKSAVTYILGYSYVDSSLFLRRLTPVFHPQWSWLYARAVVGVKFLGPVGKAKQNFDGSLYYSTYQYAEIQVEFCEVRYPIYEDDEVTYEYERYTEQVPAACAELVQIDGGQLIAYAPSVTFVDQKNYIAAPHVIARQEKNAFDLIWREVPEAFLFDQDETSSTYGKAVKIAAIQKRVNSETFFGWRPGTLLCEEATMSISPSPVATDVTVGLRFMYDVTFKMKGFDPEPGDPAVEKYGWNLLPGPRNTSGASGDRLFAYFYYTHDGTLDGKPLFESYDFASVFTHVDA
jgi:hypothetical protein